MLERLTRAISEIPTCHSPAFSHYLTQYDSQPNARRESRTSCLNCDPSWMFFFQRVIAQTEYIPTDRKAREEL